jgi:hypothetical protein
VLWNYSQGIQEIIISSLYIIIFKAVFPEDRIVTKDLDATLLDASIVWQSISVLKESGIRCARNMHIRP